MTRLPQAGLVEQDVPVATFGRDEAVSLYGVKPLDETADQSDLALAIRP
jgi:hypothetical protein